MQQHRRLERLLNALCSLSHKLGLPFTVLDPEAILRRARKVTGLRNWGDERFIEPMKKVLADAESRVLPIGRVMIRELVTRSVIHRLRIEQHLKEHPEILDIPIERPIFVLGFPRTGTTLLQNLLNQEEGHRAFRFWELTSPVPVHEDPQIDQRRRIARASSDLRLAYLFGPEMAAMHEVGPETVEECWPLFSNTFAVPNFDLCHGMRDYGLWLNGFDMRWPYREYRRMLQLLQHRNPARRLVLKCPEHLWSIDALLDVFPDACIVWTHREPADCIGSYSSLISLSRRTLYGGFDPLDVGRHIEDRFLTGVTRAMAARDRAEEQRFFDVRFTELVRDPIAMVARICDHFGLDHSAEGARRMRLWRETKRADARGQHKYRVEHYGLDRARIYERYAAYIDRFQIPLAE